MSRKVRTREYMELLNELEDHKKVIAETENTIESIEAKLEQLYEDGIDVEKIARRRENGVVA